MTAPNVGTWNVEYDNSDANIKAGLSALVSAGMDVIGCQEMSNDKKWEMATRHMAGLGFTWGGANNAVPIFVGRNWMIVKVGNEKVTSGGEKIEQSSAGSGSSTMGYKSVTWASIRHKTDGSRALVANHHIVPAIESGGKLVNPLRLAWYRTQIAAIGDVIAPSIKEGIPVAVTGDFNLSYGTEAGKDLEQRMAALGLKPCWSQTKARGTHGKRTPDYVWHNVRARKVTILPNFTSDHNPAAVDLTDDDPDPEPETPEEIPVTIDKSGKAWTPDVRAVALEVDGLFPRSEWTSTYGGHGENSPTGAYAIDFMCSKADGDKIAEYTWLNRKRLGMSYQIWNRRIRRDYDHVQNGKKIPAGQWAPYFDGQSSNPSKAHTNHVHTSYYVGHKYVGPVVVAPWDKKSFPGSEAFKVGFRDPAVTVLDLRLIAHGLTPKGYEAGENFTADTLALVKKFQAAQGWTGDSADGIPGPATWELLMKFPATTTPPVVKPPVVTPPPVVVAPPKPPAPPAVTPVYLDKLTEGTKDSDSVRVTQEALVALGAKNIAPTGDFGPGTTEAVKAFQRSLVTGVLSEAETAKLFKLAAIPVTIEKES